MTPTEIEQKWLEYAREVVSVTPSHPHWRGCLTHHAATGPGLDGGNENRFPGYLGELYRPATGVLCVAHVHREPGAPAHLGGDPWRFHEAHRNWRDTERSDRADEAFLAEVRRYYLAKARDWNPWQFFSRVVEGELGLDLRHVAWANLAKCRQDPRYPAQKLAEFCIRDFPPARLVGLLRPVAVIVCVISADPSRGMKWSTPDWAPLVFACEGRNGRDIHRRRPTVWAPEAAARIRERWAELGSAPHETRPLRNRR